MEGTALERMVAGVLAWSALVALICCGAWDLYAAQRGAIGATVSRQIWSWQERLPILVLLIGILIGHLFFPLVLTNGTVVPTKTVLKVPEVLPPK